MNIRYPTTFVQWPNNARQFIVDLCGNIEFSVQIVGFMETFYCIYIWIDENHQQSINQLLIQRDLAIEFDDSQSPEVREFEIK